jgi:hypothetical protein
MTERDFWLQQRAALIKQAKALKEQYDGVLQQIAAIERMYNIEKKPPQTVAIQPQDSIAGIMAMEGNNT